jgi:uncharacterized protein
MSMGVHEVTLHPSPADLELSEDEFDNIECRVRLDVGENQILVQFETEVDAFLTCDRTLKPFTMRLQGAFTVVFTRRTAEPEPADETVRYLDPSDRQLDLTAEIRDTILLSVPLRKVAPEADRAELVLSYGSEPSDSTVDPRWDALKKLRI